MRTPSGQFLRHLRTRLPWVVAIAAVLAAASTGTFWATTRIQSLDTDLSTAGQRSTELRRQLEDLRDVNDDLRGRLTQMRSALANSSVSMRELSQRNRKLRNCVSKSNPSGEPVVTLVPGHGPEGTRVEMVGHCFVGRFWRRPEPSAGYAITLRGVGATCRVRARASGAARIRRGRMRGYFIVPNDGRCLRQAGGSGVAPGGYELAVGCRKCSLADFRVTTETGERNRLPACRSGDFGWSLQGPDGATAMKIVGVKVYPIRNTTCRLTLAASVSIVDAAGTSLNIQGNSGRAEFDAAVGRQRIGAAWAWTNWCGTGSYRVRVTLGTETRSTALQSDGPRCEFKKYASRLRPIVPWMEGVNSFTR